MKWARCPSCGTVNDLDRYAMCDGCSGDLAGVPPIEEPRPSRAPGDARRDPVPRRSSVSWMSVASIFGLGATFLLPQGITILTALVTFILIFCVFWNLYSRTLVGARFGPFVTAVLGLFGIIAALLGALILVGLACVGNLSGTRFG
jgi:hypothetical protein